MSTLHIYDMTVPVLLRELETMTAFLKKAQGYLLEQGLDDKTLLEWRLAPDMAALPFQVACTTNMVYSAIVGPAWTWVPTATMGEDYPKDFDGMFERLKTCVISLQSKTKDDMDGGAAMPIEFWPLGVPGQGPYLNFSSGLMFINQFILPNVYFHIVTAYNICRNAGVPLGKRDWLVGAGNFHGNRLPMDQMHS